MQQDRLIDHAGQPQSGDAGHLETEPATERPGRKSAHRHRPQGQKGIEGDLQTEGPRRGIAPADRRAGIDLGEAEVGRHTAGREHVVVGHEQGGQRQRHPVGGHDAQDPPPRVRPDRGRCLTAQMVEHERPVEQEAGDDEEDDDADLHAGDERAAGDAECAAVDADRVKEQHAERGQCPDRVEQRKSLGARVHDAEPGTSPRRPRAAERVIAPARPSRMTAATPTQWA